MNPPYLERLEMAVTVWGTNVQRMIHNWLTSMNDSARIFMGLTQEHRSQIRLRVPVLNSAKVTKGRNGRNKRSMVTGFLKTIPSPPD